MKETELTKWIEKINKENASIDLTDEFETCLRQTEADFKWERVNEEFITIETETIKLKKKEVRNALRVSELSELNAKLLMKTAFDCIKKRTGKNRKAYFYKIIASPVKWERIDQVGDNSKGYRHLKLQYLTITDDEINKLRKEIKIKNEKKRKEMEKELAAKELDKKAESEISS
ncbi:MAG: hypothetical protein PHR06_00815 [Candidatus Cloacimonetes bacterium]|nr:hypothetical protein [Candidatus Cloacimonadota bacterium]